MRRLIIATVLAAVACAAIARAQAPAARDASPSGSVSMQVGTWTAADKPGARATNGKWIEVTYGRPVKRGRTNLFGAGADYGKTLNADAPVWRAGANVSTRFKTEAALMFGDKRVPAGEYSLFIDLKSPTAWTLILSSHAAQQTYDPKNKAALWGSYDYTPDKDVLRVPMRIESLPYSVEQLTYIFTDANGTGGTLRLMWDNVMASVSFKVAS